MATRSTKKTTTITSMSSSSSSDTPKTGRSTDATSTPSSSKSARSGRMSPLSPQRISRLQEKVDLQNLNDRLAAYIDRVRQLEFENNRLNVQVETIQESMQKEVVSVKSIYEQELADARRLLDDTAKEKAALQIEAGKFKTENEDLRLKLHRKERDLAAAEKALTQAQHDVDNLQGRCNALENEKKKMLIELRDLRDEVAKLTRSLAETKQQLESETLLRVDLENRLQSLKEELQFKAQVYDKEISETRSKKQVEISEIDGRLQEEYESKMQENLQELRDQYEDQLRQNRSEIEHLYESKLEDLNRRLSRGLADSDDMTNMLKDSKTRINELTGRLSYLESTNNNLQQRVNDLEGILDRERDSHRAEVLALKDELEMLREQMSQQLSEYQDLMDIKIALDMEISAYRKLLEAEESRLNLTPGGSLSRKDETPGRRTPLRPLKRKRVVEEDVTHKSAFKSSARATGDVEISEECSEGQFIRITNKSDKDLAIGGYQLCRYAGVEEVTYKFHRQLKMPPNSTITVWSSNAGQTHEAPHNLVMKNQAWPVADAMKTQFLSADGDELAIVESRRQKESFSTSSHLGGYKRAHLEGDKEKCSVM